MLALLLVAASVGLSNFAAAISLGVAGVDGRTRLRVGLVFGAFESGMPVVGLLIGDHVAARLGQASRWIGGALLIGVGLYAIVTSIRASRAARGRPPAPSAAPAAPDLATAGRPLLAAPTDEAAPAAARPASAHGGLTGSTPQLLLSGLALSLDNLVVGFALGTYQVALVISAIVIGAVSVGLSLIGLELGARLGSWAGERSDQLGGLILISVGAAVAAGALQ
jgi:manganese efflux pump family protein